MFKTTQKSIDKATEASRSRPVSRVGGRAVENERSAPALRAHTSQREAGKHASLCEAMRSSRSVIYTPEALHFLEAPHIWLASNRTTFSVCAVCMAERKEPILFFEQGIT